MSMLHGAHLLILQSLQCPHGLEELMLIEVFTTNFRAFSACMDLKS